MSRAFVDTTILTDILLGVPHKKAVAQESLERFDETEMPQYAIKEFKLGPLTNFNWMHTKLVQTQSLSDSLAALQALAATPQRYKTATAIQALATAVDSIGYATPSDLSKKYGSNASIQKIIFDETRIAIKAMILSAWRRRRKVTDKVVCPLSCYEEKDPSIRRELIDIKPRDCPKNEECCAAGEMKNRPSDLMKMRDATLASGNRLELTKRAQALRKLYRTPKRPVYRDTCRALGDAVFAYFAPEGSVILTTNLRDHGPLATSLEKVAETP